MGMSGQHIFSGEVASSNLADIVQFYVQLSGIFRLELSCQNLKGNIWINQNRITHATTKDNFGVDALYEIMGWRDGEFKVFKAEVPEYESINRNWTDLSLQYYVLQDQEKQLYQETKVEIKPIIQIDPMDELDFSGLNEPEIVRPSTLPTLTKKPINGIPNGFRKNSPLKPSIHSYRSKIKPITELDGFLAISIVDTNTGMSLIEQTKDNSIDLEIYSAYIVEVVKSHRKFLSKLNIKENIEDIVINLDSRYHIITFVTKYDNLFIYVILNKEESNLAITRLTLMSIQEELV